MFKTMVVVDSLADSFTLDGVTVVGFDQYLADYPKRNEPKTRLINLCDTEHYLSKGYYCSLLAEARQHKALPSVSTINDLRDFTLSTSAGLRLPLPEEVALSEGESLEFLAYFGWTDQEPWKKFSRQVFDRYPSPILRFSVTSSGQTLLLQIARVGFAQLEDEQRTVFLDRLSKFTENVWRQSAAAKKYRWEMAILVNPAETHPPSDKDAIKRFIKAAAKVGIHAETITSDQASQINQYDALFIRETTAIDHPTYRIARKAEQEGLVVIDDSASILRCCNKVYLHDAFSYNGVPSLKTLVVTKADDEELTRLEEAFGYPLVLKMPEGAFSKGVFKIKDRAQLKEKLDELLTDTALVLAQEYCFTDYDWRIGVLNGRAIFACRYHMARNHWQIYNHDAKKRFTSGGFETLPTFEAPRAVLDAALKASAMIGNGLYGVDLKQHEGKVYVIEVNDNPSIDHEVEDLYLGNELYMLIMSEFVNRLEQRGRRK